VIYDAVVVGAGLAGFVAAARLAEAGARVTLVAKGVGAIQLAPSTIDVLGYAPEPVTSPVDALSRFVADHPLHPYAHLGSDAIRSSLEWFSARTGDLAYGGSIDDNMLLPTAVGALKPTALVPAAMAAGDVRWARRVAIVGWRSLKDFYAPYLADNLVRAAAQREIDLSARALLVDSPNEAGADPGPLGCARWFEAPASRRRLMAEIRGRLRSEDAVGFPAVLGVERHAEVWADLQDGLGARVFEIPTLPPSVPGLRLLTRYKSDLRSAGARVVVGSPVVGSESAGDRLQAMVAASAARSRPVRARDFVLASGGWAAGGIEMDSRWRVRETILGLPVAGVPEPGEPRWTESYLTEHPLGRAGIAVDDHLRPLGTTGEPVYRNLRAAGATLAGALPWREKSGDGISLSTGHRAAESIIEEKS
jgi:glycerol-3-phosphate dehydrogenase subunit B